MNIPKKHHFLPQFYLKAFQSSISRKIPKIHVVEKSHNCRNFLASVQDTGCKRDYHTINEGNRVKVEFDLSRVENFHSSILKKIIDTSSLDQINLNELAAVILFMRNRVPNVKVFVEKSIENVVKSSFNILLDQGVLPKAPSVVQEIIDSGKSPIKVKISNDRVLYYMFSMAEDKKAIKLLSSMNFSLFKAPKNSYFLTSDAPISLYVPNYKLRKPYITGLMNKDIEVAFPISKEYLLFASWGDCVLSGEITDFKVEEYNRRTIISAQNYIYSNICNKNVVEQVKKYYDLSSGIEVSSMKVKNGVFHSSRFIPVSGKKVIHT